MAIPKMPLCLVQHLTYFANRQKMFFYDIFLTLWIISKKRLFQIKKPTTNKIRFQQILFAELFNYTAFKSKHPLRLLLIKSKP